MVTREILNQYSDLQREIRETREKIDRLEARIPKIEKRIREIESGEVVKDKVRGGLGGIQTFTIEGLPTREYNDKKTELLLKKRLLEERKEMLSLLELEGLRQVNEIEKFINSIKDSHIRRIVALRVVEGLSWNEVADVIGGNTQDSVKKAFYRYLDLEKL